MLVDTDLYLVKPQCLSICIDIYPFELCDLKNKLILTANQSSTLDHL